MKITLKIYASNPEFAMIKLKILVNSATTHQPKFY